MGDVEEVFDEVHRAAVNGKHRLDAAARARAVVANADLCRRERRTRPDGDVTGRDTAPAQIETAGATGQRADVDRRIEERDVNRGVRDIRNAKGEGVDVRAGVRAALAEAHDFRALGSVQRPAARRHAAFQIRSAARNPQRAVDRAGVNGRA